MKLGRILWSLLLTILLLEWIGGHNSGGRSVALVQATLKDHKNMVYTLPRPGVQTTEDCYTDTYADDLKRDLALMHDLSVTTVMGWNGWDFGRPHGIFLGELSKYNMTLGITFKPDLDGVMRKNLEKLSKLLEEHKVKLEFLYLDYPLDFDNAETFFRWVTQVRGWMLQLDNLNAPLFVRFFPEVTNPKTVQVLLQQWDEGSFDAWVVEAYSSTSMVSWLNRMEGNTKKLFFVYGADTWTMLNSTSDFESQAPQLATLLNLIELGQYDAPLNLTVPPPVSENPDLEMSPEDSVPLDEIIPEDSRRSLLSHSSHHRELTYAYIGRHLIRTEFAEPITSNLTTMVDVGDIAVRLLSGAIQGFSDIWFLGRGSNYFQGGALDVCPDRNPYLHTSCGGTDPFISYGDKYYSVEHLGIFRHYETVYYFRCIDPTEASLMLQKRWNPKLSKPIVSTCTLSISIPAFYVFYIWGGGFAAALLTLLASCCRPSN